MSTDEIPYELPGSTVFPGALGRGDNPGRASGRSPARGSSRKRAQKTDRREASSLDNNNLLRPIPVALALLAFGVLCTLIDSRIYQSLVHERDLMNGNLALYGYLALCTVMFMAFAAVGTYFTKQVLPKSRPWIDTVTTRKDSVVSAIIWSAIILGLVLTIVRLYYLNSTIGLGVILNGLNGSGSQLRDRIIEVIANGSVGWISDVTLGLSSAVLWIALQVKSRRRRWFMTLAYANLAVFVFANLLTLSRDIMLTGILIAIILQIATLANNGALSKIKIFLTAIAGVVVFAVLFSYVGQSRASGTQDNPAAQFVGYFPASYNRLAALIDNQLRFPNSNWGFYTTQLFWDFPVVTNIYDLHDIGKNAGLDIPLTTIENWNNQFLSVKYAGLNRSYIWTTAYGFAFSDFGWFGSLVFGLFGLVGSVLYALFRQGKLLGGILYPYFLTTVIKWWSILYFSSRTTDVMLLVVGFIAVVTWFFNTARARLAPQIRN